ncbi:MAG: FxsA family protein [Nocardioides sp.]
MARRRSVAWILFVAFIVVPILEIYVLIQVGQVIGPWWTVLLLILDSIIGSWVIRKEGARAWRALQSALSTGRMPARELADGALILIGGTFMLSPGFVTDAFGILLILPFTRPVFRALLTRVVTHRLIVLGPGFGGPNAPRPGPGSQGPVIRGEVVDE